MITPLSPGLPGANTSSLETALKRLGSGSRINSAKDDAAGLAIATQMAAQLGGNSQAMRNVYDGLSLTEVAGGGLSQVSESLQRMRELTLQAANGTNNASDLQAIQGEIDQLGEGLDQIAGTTQFNGQNVLDGSFSAQLQTGPNAGDTQTLALGDASRQSLGIAGLDVSSPANAASALDAIDNALTKVNAQQVDIGAAQAGLNSTLANLSGSYENLAAAKSRIADTDYAAEASNFSQSQVRAEAANRALSAYNKMQKGVLGLLP